MEDLSQLPNVPQLLKLLVALTPKLLAAASVLFVFWILYRTTRSSLWAVLRRAGFDDTLIRMLVDNVYQFSLFLFAVVMAASQLEIKVGAALAGLGIVGIAVGFAAQDTLANIIAGFLIFWDRPFLVGDYVTVNGQFGMICEITMRTTRIRTENNTYVVIPNRRIIDEILVNHSKNGETRINVPVTIAYEESIPEARKVMLAALRGVEGIAQSPAPDVVVKQLGVAGVDLLVRVSIHEARDESRLYHWTLEACKSALDRARIQIPYPQMGLIMGGGKEPDEVWEQSTSSTRQRKAA